MADSPEQSKLTTDSHNANKGTVRGLGMVERSLQQYGAGRSILVDRHGVAIAGNKTLETARGLGIPIQVIESDGRTLYAIKRTDLDLATDESAKALGIADNRSSELGLEWDPDVLNALAADGVDLSQFWFEDELADVLMGDDEPILPGLTDPDDVPAVPDDPITKPGDLWLLGKQHRIMCGNSTNPIDVDRLLQGATPDFVFSDPPYGISIVDGNGSIGASNMVEVGRYQEVIGDNTTQTAIDAFTLTDALAPKAVHVWWGGNYYAHALPPSSCWIIWDKENTGNFADAELAWTNRPTAVRIFRHMWNGLMKASERGERRVHPTQKPVALAEWCFHQYGKESDLVYDPFLGSGISLIAGEALGRSVYGMDMSPGYIDVCVKRWEKHTGLTATRVDDAEALAAD